MYLVSGQTLFIAPLGCSLLDKEAHSVPKTIECGGDIVDQNRNLSANCTCREVWVVLIMLPAAELYPPVAVVIAVKLGKPKSV